MTMVVLLFSLASGYIFLDKNINNSINKQILNQYININKLFRLSMHQNQHRYIVKLHRLINKADMIEAIYKKDSNKIVKIVEPIYKILKKHDKSVEVLIFRSSDADILYSSNNKNKDILKDKNLLKKLSSGYEINNNQISYNIIEPIFYQDKYIGSVELKINTDYFTKDIQSIFNIKLALVTKNLNFITGDKIIKNMLENNSSRSTLNMDIALKDYYDNKIAYLAVYLDAMNIINENKQTMHHLFILISFLMIILGVILNYGFNKLLKHFTKETFTDHLTGLRNRIALDNVLASSDNYVLILSNIRDFSVINELYGSSIGNEVLVEIGKCFKEFAKANDFEAFRISSDEYVLVKQDSVPDAEEYNDLLEKLHQKISALNIYIEDIYNSIFVKIYSGITFNSTNAIINAHMALKKAKQNYLPYLAYSEQVDTKEQIKNNIEIKNIIHVAIEADNVIPFFQPITNREGKIIKYEALIRIISLQNNNKKIIFPDDFLEIAKHNGQYVEVTKRMIQRSLSLFAKKEEKISINLTPGDLFNPSIMEVLRKEIKEFGNPKKIIIEITEQESIKDFQRVLKVIKRLRMLGVCIAIDDFGSGYANYAHILTVKPDYLKIDGSLVKNLLTDKDSKILVKSIVNFAKDLNIKTIAEYVENREIFELLKSYGVDEFQGYYFSKPIELIKDYEKNL